MMQEKTTIAVAFAAFAIAAICTSWAQEVEPPFRALGSLKGLQPPLPNLNGILKDSTPATRAQVVALGKAFYWDQQAGSDGQACASCHFAAGSDNRIRNQLTPGLTDVRFPGGDVAFGGLEADGVINEPAGFTPLNDLSPAGTAGKTASGQTAKSNITALGTDFPFHQLANPLDRNSAIVYTTNDAFTSQGTFGAPFIGVVPGALNDNCGIASGAVFHNDANQPARKVEPLQTPTVINAAFNFRNFWNGRANNIFNGEDPFGNRNTKAFVVKKTSTGVAKQKLRLVNASLASQAVGPALSDFEMSCAGRTFAHVGRKLLPSTALAFQDVASTDSVLAPYHNPAGGLTKTYRDLIHSAFHSKWWSAAGKWCRVNGNLVKEASGATNCKPGKGFTQEELNFSMFWGIAIMLYESTLSSDDSPFDRHFDATATLSDAELRGLGLFVGKGGCANCHDGPELTKAATHLQPEAQEKGLVERMLMAQGSIRPALYDNGFYNIGVTPTVQFLGVGGKDPFGNPLSFTRQFLNKQPFPTTIAQQNFKDKFKVDPCKFDILVLGPRETCDPNAELAALAASGPKNERQAVDGAVKTPTLRNVGLTAPYFHNGGYATLKSVVEFYNRGGNRRGNDNPNEVLHDSSGTGPLGRSSPLQNQQVGSNSDPDIVPLGLIVDPDQGIDEVGDLVAFMLSLSDERVACQSGVFDHPSIELFNGHTDIGLGLHAEDETFVLPAVGQEGFLGTGCLTNSGDLFLP